ncbi:hypothetical protein CRG98_008314 [Punica granatum]|uniref:Uncharacterized protein n=1 Tax=Punica granatum TaxID=22663 RepID=A0A2I0KS48_PUNGR|nr:hypothetical protein CRG98_008314 [Punica granatum]
MAGLNLQSKSKRRKIVVLTAWIQMCTILSNLMTLLLVLATLYSPESSTRSYDISRARLPPGEEPGTSGRKRKRNQTDLSTIFEAVNSMTADMKEAWVMLSRSVHCDIVQEKLLELPGALRSVDGLTKAKDYKLDFFVELFGLLRLSQAIWVV